MIKSLPPSSISAFTILSTTFHGQNILHIAKRKTKFKNKMQIVCVLVVQHNAYISFYDDGCI